ncbi:MAG: HEAT repeat domain-containing protein, partial [Planctomycetota bacterium]
MWKLNRLLVLIASLTTATTVHASSQEAQLLEVLNSDATLREKSDACRQLARIATKESVPTLSALLKDDKLAHMARYALEPIPDPSVDQALRDALGQVSGRVKLGVIGSLGARRDAQAVDALAELLRQEAVAQAAARALGNIGVLEAAEALEAALPGKSGAVQLAVCEGLLRCAEALAARDQTEPSQAIYDRLRLSSALPTQVRAAALRGAILAREEQGAALLVEAMQDDDYALA